MISQTFKQEYQYLRKNKYLPGPKVLQIEITNKCCLHCPQCYKPPVEQLKSMTFVEFKKYVDMAVDIGVKEISLLGGEPVNKKGLSLLQAPGNDLVAANALAVSGAQLILFTTGRGTPFGCPVPTAKISSNSALKNKKKTWIDFNAGQLLENKSMPELTDEFLDFVLKLASGEITAKAEGLNKHEVAIFKDGVAL